MSLKHEDKIFIAGHRGMVGSAILRNLKTKGFDNIITANKKDLDLTSQEQVKDFFNQKRLDKKFSRI